MSARVRPERQDDEAAVRALTDAAFLGQPYSQGNEGAITDRLREAGALLLSLVAVEDTDASNEAAGETVIGHAAFSPVGISGMSGRWIGLGPLAVRPDRQRQGVGSVLLREGLSHLRGTDVRGCVLVGDPAYYARFGFRTWPELTYSDVPHRYVQALPFFPGASVRGEIAFHSAFCEEQS